MSKRPFVIFYVLIVIAVWLLCMTIIAIATPPAKSVPAADNSSFHRVDDLPIITSLDQYYELVNTGRTAITVDGHEFWIFWGDFSQDEKQKLQLRLRTP